MKHNKIRLLFSAFAIAGLSLFLPSVPLGDQSFSLGLLAQTSPLELEQIDISEIANQIMALQKYMQVDNTTKIATFDSQTAKKDGFSKSIIDLASELIEHQNALMREAAKQKLGDITQISVSEDSFPRLKKFHERLRERDRKKSSPSSFIIESSHFNQRIASKILGKISLSNIEFQKPLDYKNSEILIAELTARACGDYSHHIPNYTPYTTGWTTTANPHTALGNLGYHKTAQYASYQGSYGYSYTKERSYTSSYGTCNFPVFRDEGKVNTTSTAYRIQYGEPNPEVFNYNWPYPAWADYCKYWHSLY